MAFAYNTSVHATTGLTPFEIVYGRKPKLPVDLMFPVPELELNLDVDSYAKKTQQKLLCYYDIVVKNTDSKVSKFKFYADRNVRRVVYVVGDRVWLLNSAKKKGVSKKLSRKWTGPFSVVEVRNENNYLIKPDACATIRSLKRKKKH